MSLKIKMTKAVAVRHCVDSTCNSFVTGWGTTLSPAWWCFSGGSSLAGFSYAIQLLKGTESLIKEKMTCTFHVVWLSAYSTRYLKKQGATNSKVTSVIAQLFLFHPVAYMRVDSALLILSKDCRNHLWEFACLFDRSEAAMEHVSPLARLAVDQKKKRYAWHILVFRCAEINSFS